jgi:hypothetical protein
MSRKIRVSPVERLVDAYLVRLRKTNNNRRDRAILEKAAKMIEMALEDPCCNNEVVILGRQENYFTISLRSLLNGIDIRKWRESLERAALSLRKEFDDPCCYLTQAIQGLIENNEGSGSATINTITVNYSSGDASPVYVSGGDLPLNVGNNGQFTILNGIHTVQVLGSGVQLGMFWRITDSNGNVQSAPYVAGDTHDFVNVAINNGNSWKIEVLPA